MDSETKTTWWSRHLVGLAQQIAANEYFVPAEAIAEAILHGRPKWGKDPVFIGYNSAMDASRSAR